MILLTGASGYLGRHVLPKLEARGLPHMATSLSGTVGASCDLLSNHETWLLLERVKPAVIVHCAAAVNYSDVALADDSQLMTWNLWDACDAPVVLASSHLAETPEVNAYARSKSLSEGFVLRREGCVLRLPGLFGLPRRAGVIYASALNGDVKDSYGPYPAMHVADAAEYLVRAATMPSDGHPEPFSVTYGDARLEACYGSLGVTFQQRVQEFAKTLRREQPICRE
jgi:nucleoside-diphosphate-sugar epimerase